MNKIFLKLLNLNFFYFLFLIISFNYFYFFSENGRKKRLYYKKELNRLENKYKKLLKKRIYLEREVFKIKNIPKISEYNSRDRYDLISKNNDELYFYIK